MSSKSESTHREDRTFEKLINAPFFATYCKAFKDATGMGIQLIPFGEEFPASAIQFRSPFCAILNQSKDGCRLCNRACKNLYRTADTTAHTITCFANLRETAIPIRTGERTVALLTTGQIFTSVPTEKGFETVKEQLEQNGTTPSQIVKLKEAWLHTKNLPIEQYEGIITLLAAFAIQFSEYLNRLLVEENHSEPNVVKKAKQFVNANLEGRVTLDVVAPHVGVSTYYLCKIFKRTTGMTLTEHVNRRRIERAKQMLLNPQYRVTEVAFEVGYQSLSQFNRSFLRYVGVSPSRFRKRQSAENAIQRLDAA